MRDTQTYFVYILISTSGTTYIGVTNDLMRRMDEHKRGTVEGFSKRYKITKLIYFEETDSIHDAIDREKQIKGWSRKKKLDLVRTMNPTFEDLSADWFE